MTLPNPHAPDPAEVFDSTMRWHVASRNTPGETYLVDVSAYAGNGTCQCPDFACRFAPILSRAITAEQAVEQRLVTLRPYHCGNPKNALRCAHIMQARGDFADALIKALTEAKRAQAHPAQP